MADIMPGGDAQRDALPAVTLGDERITADPGTSLGCAHRSAGAGHAGAVRAVVGRLGGREELGLAVAFDEDCAGWCSARYYFVRSHPATARNHGIHPLDALCDATGPQPMDAITNRLIGHRA